MTLVVDASVLLAGLVDNGAAGGWAREQLRTPHLLAPHVLPVEVTSGLRRLVSGGVVSPGAAYAALHELHERRIDLYPFEPFTDRVWELRANVTAYDAWYVALAEAHGCALATLDHRLVEAPGPVCDLVTS